LKVGLNATCINDRPSGAKQRFIGIYGHLVRRLPEVEFVIFEPADCRMRQWFADAPNVSTRSTPIPSEGRVGKLVKSLGFWHGAMRRETFDLFEGFHLPLEKPRSGRTLITIHDIRRIQHDWGWLERTAFRHALTSAIKKSDHVITVSDVMKQEMSPYCGQTPVSVIPNGLEPAAFEDVSTDHLDAFRRKFGLPVGFLLAVGHLERRKNYPALIDAVALLRDRGQPCPLVIIGNNSGERRIIEERIAAHKLDGTVWMLNRLSDLEVRCAYRLCSAFVFPSTYEGFGTPILEAMAAGVPVALSDIAVFREITEHKSEYFAPYDPEAMASSIERVLGAQDLRAEMIEYGRGRVQAFDFVHTAARYQHLYEDLAVSST